MAYRSFMGHVLDMASEKLPDARRSVSAWGESNGDTYQGDVLSELSMFLNVPLHIATFFLTR